jgi:hypothetical protein
MPEKMIRTKMVDGSERRLSMPAEYELTFGPNVPFAPREHRFGTHANTVGFALRVYSTNPKMLRMCMPNVVEFWEEATFVIEHIQRDPESQLVVQRVDMNEVAMTPPTAARRNMQRRMAELQRDMMAASTASLSTQVHDAWAEVAAPTRPIAQQEAESREV